MYDTVCGHVRMMHCVDMYDALCGHAVCAYVVHNSYVLYACN